MAFVTLTSPSISLCLISALVFLCLCFVAAAKIPEDVTNLQDFSDMTGTMLSDDDPLNEVLPDPATPQFYQPLKCAACGAIVEEAVELLRPVIERHLVRRARSLRDGGKKSRVLFPKETETIDTVERLCNKVVSQYGLEMKNSTPSLSFSKSPFVQRVHGKWMPSFLSSTCEQLLDEKEAEFFSAIFTEAEKNEDKKGGENELKKNVRSIFCTRWKRSADGCDDAGSPIDPKADDSDEL